MALLEIYKVGLTGILHVAGSESCSKYEFAHKIADIFHYDKRLIHSSSITTQHLNARRGKNMSLDTTKARSLLATHFPSVEEGLHKMKRVCDQGYVKRLKEL
jgi:dTDP-4-dehydrorhamnose reductase